MDDNRQAAIEHFQRIIDATDTDGRYNLGFIDGLEFCINHLSTMPSAQPEQKHGKWEVIDEVPPRRYGCSICKKLSWYQYNYCPNCGARMEGEE